jgi:Recombination endonuclease VII
MKRCPDCLQCKPLSDFPRNRRTKSGYATYCKLRHNARGRETRQRLYGGGRHYHLRRRYGIGAAEFDDLVRGQGGVCPICNEADPEHVDHDHLTGRVRGILCFNCNGGLGQFGDDTERLVRAQLYIDWSDMTPEERKCSSDLARRRVEALRESAA